MEQLTVNVKGKAKRKTLFGREYLVANMTLIVPGVLTGSAGPLYYPPEEVSRYPEIWNHKPITLNHPNGSTSDPDVLNNTQLGFVLNAQYKYGKLVAEGWFDVHRVSQVEQRIITNLVQGTPFELSTGLGVDFEQVENGNHNGIPYVAITRNLRPDHLAILIDSVGACSLKDGCGVLTNESGEQITIGNALSHEQVRDEIHRSLASLFKQDEPRPYILAVFDGFFVYEQGNKLLKRSYSMIDGKISLASDAKQVRKEVDFKPISNINSDRKDRTMASEAIVKDLITNCDCWTDKHKDVLLNMEEEDVKKLLDKAKAAKRNELVANAAKAGFEGHVWNEEKQTWEKKEEKSGKDKKDDEPNPTTNNQGLTKEALKATLKEMDEAEWFDAAPPGVQQVVANAKAIEDSERKELVALVVKNSVEEDKESNKAIAEKMEIPALRGWASTLKNQNDNGNPFRRSGGNYAGAVGGVSNEGIAKPTPLGLPVWQD